MPDYDPQNAGNKPGEGPLRPGGRPPPEDGLKPSKGPNLPSTKNKARERQQDALELVRDLYEGTEAVKGKGKVYLPENLGEDATNYTARKKMTVFFNAFRRTVEGLTGLVFSADPVLSDDVPPQIVEHWENIDQAGTHGDVFLRERFEDALTAGHGAILVEFPKTGGGQTKRPEVMGEVRPYWVPILKDDILSWRTSVENGKQVLMQVVIRERYLEPRGAFGEEQKVRYRVLFRRSAAAAKESDEGDEATVGFRVLTIDEDKIVREVDRGWYPTQEQIPLVEIPTSGKRGLFDSDPPLLNLAYLNLAHYQQWSDYTWSKHKTCVPIFVVSGMERATDETGNERPLKIGPNSALVLENPQARASYQAHDGASLDSCKQALDDLKSDMGTQGLSMLAPQKRAAETAEAKRLDKATSDSALSVAARALQDAAENALKIHARYLGLDEGGSVTINRDFEQLALDSSVMGAYAQLMREGLPIEMVLEMLQRGGRLPEDQDLESLALEMAAEAVARRQQEAEDAEGAGEPAGAAAG